MIEVGDKVGYLPAEVHCNQPHPITGFPWVYGWKTGRKDRAGQEETLELTNDELAHKLRHIKRQTGDRATIERKRLVPIRPNGFWTATVKAISEDGAKLDLDIQDPTTGATLNYAGVPLDPSKTQFHSCHEVR